VARHYALAGRDAECALWQRRAAEVAIRRNAWELALAALESALALGTDPAERLAARLLAARVQRHRADIAAAEGHLHEAMAEAAQLGPRQVIEVTLAQTELQCETGHAAAALPTLEALEQDPALAEDQRRTLATQRANALALLGRHAESLPLLRRLRDALPPSALHDRWRVQTRLVRNLYFAGERDSLQTELTAGLRLAQQIGDESHIADMTYKLGIVARERGEVETALTHLNEAVAIARRIGDVERLRAALAAACTIWLDRMELEQAEAALAEGEQAAPGWDSIDLEDVYAHRRHRLHLLRGELREAWALTRERLQRNLHHSHLHCVLGTHIQAVRLALADGDAAMARAYLAAGQQRHAAAGADSLHGDELAAIEVEVLHAEGRHGEAVQAAQRWLAGARPTRVDDVAPLLAAAIAAAATCGELARARAWWAQAEALPVLCLSTRAALLGARLACVRADPHSTPRERAAAESAVAAWLALPRRPVLAEQTLRGIAPG
jgi:tetratricopeptide (TPR) repeat protein